MPHIAIITRASRDREDGRISVDRQYQRCLVLATDLFPGVEVTEYRDNNESGADPTAKRERFHAFLDQLRAGEVLEVVAHEQSRITRIPEVWEKLTVALSLAGIEKIHTVQAGTVTVGAGNRLVGRLLNIIDAEEVERARARTLAAHNQLAKEGRPSGGNQYGYGKAVGVDGRATMVINVDEARIIRDIAAKLIEGHSVTSIINDLNAADVPPPGRAKKTGGKRWYMTTLKGAITRPTIAGLRVHHGEIVGRGIWEPIISEDLWRKACKAMGSGMVKGSDGKTYKTSRQHRADGRKWLLTGGLTRCALCQSPLVVMHNGNGRISYCCHKSVSAESCGKVSMSQASTVEAFVVGEVFAAAEKSSKLRKRLANEPDPKREKLRAEIEDLEDRLKRTARSFLDAGLDGSDLDEVTAETKDKVARARASLASLPDPDVELPPYHEIEARWDEMPLRQRRAFIDRAVSSILVAPAPYKGQPKRTERIAWLRNRITLIWRV